MTSLGNSPRKKASIKVISFLKHAASKEVATYLTHTYIYYVCLPGFQEVTRLILI